MKIISWFSFFVVIKSCLSKDNSTLKSVAVLFRHGERNIQRPYPGDAYGNLIYWPGGYGQLINKGKQHHYELGKWFRQRYDGFLPRAYNVYDLHVHSTNMDRTLMSAASHLAGLYPPPEVQKFNDELPWQPIPIHTEPSVGLSDSSECPKYDKLYNELLESEEFAPWKTLVKETLTYASQFTGNRVRTLSDLLLMYDNLLVESQFGYELPKWTQAIFPEKLSKIAVQMFKSFCYTPDLARLKIGGFILELLTVFAGVNTGDPSQYKKYNIYSAHDVTIANVLTALGIDFQEAPPYAAALIFEFRELDGEYFVNLLYKNSTLEPHNLNIKNCTFDCFSMNFLEQVNKIAISQDQRSSECFEDFN